MNIPLVCLVVITFILGFVAGKIYILRSLALRAVQLYEEYDCRKAQWLEELLDEEEAE